MGQSRLALVVERLVAELAGADPDSAGRFRDYLRDLPRMTGMFFFEDLVTLLILAGCLKSAGVSGDILEIGAYHGKSAVLLGFLLGPGERLQVSDLFGEGPVRAEATDNLAAAFASLTPEIFRRNYDRYHPQAPPVLHVGYSSCLGEKLEGTFKLIHVDGGHDFESVTQDIELALGRLAPRGVLVIDDFRVAHLPQVAAATWAAVADGRLRPLMVTREKFYGVRSAAPELLDLMAQRCQQSGLLKGNIKHVSGHPFLVLRYAGQVPETPSERLHTILSSLMNWALGQSLESRPR